MAELLSNSTVTANAASLSGGGLLLVGAGPNTISARTIDHNSAGRRGGVAIGSGSSVTIALSTIGPNTASSEGGVFAYNPSGVTLLHDTVAFNEASDPAGGAGVYSSGGSIYLQDTLVPWLSKREGLMEKGLDINPSPDRLYTAAVQHLLKGLAEAAITASASQDTPTPDTVSPV